VLPRSAAPSVETVSPLASLAPSARFVRLDLALRKAGLVRQYLQPCNASITLHEGQLWAVIKMTEWYLGLSRWNHLEIDTALARIGPNLELLVPRILRDRDPSPRHPKGTITGFEDARIFSWRSKLWLSTTVYDRDSGTRARMALCEVSPGESIVKKIHVLSDGSRDEKNWMPWVDGDELHLLYKAKPPLVLDIGLHEAALRVVQKDIRRAFAGPGTDHLHGGSQLVEIAPGRWLCAVHWRNGRMVPGTVTDRGPYLDHPKGVTRLQHVPMYVHRFLEFARGPGSSLRLVAASPGFLFVHEGIEFCAGIVAVEGKLLLSFGVDDVRRESWICEVNAGEIVSMLSPVG
jgi:hypothetical protein